MERVRDANGNSFSTAAGNDTGNADGVRRPVPTWKFGVSPGSHNADRGSI